MRLPNELLLIVFLFLVGCSDYSEYSPNQIHDGNTDISLNKLNLLKLDAIRPDDTLTIAFIGDTQNFYDEVDRFVKQANQMTDIDFVLLAGDISDYGLRQELEWITERLNRLNRPFLSVIGNHDLVGNGEAVYTRMFGPLDFSFVYDSTKFIIHNTNSREYLTKNVPDMLWLEQELESQIGVKYFVAVSHVPPFSGDFNPDLEEQYSNLWQSTPGFLLSLHGHIHRHTDGYPYEDGIRYITSHAMEQRSFVLLKISSGNVAKKIINY